MKFPSSDANLASSVYICFKSGQGYSDYKTLSEHLLTIIHKSLLTTMHNSDSASGYQKRFRSLLTRIQYLDL